MNHWSFVAAAYAVTVIGAGALSVQSWLAMRRAEAAARRLLDLGAPIEETPWTGTRPCLPGMLPLVMQAPRHRGLWLNFGHGHPALLAVARGQLERLTLTSRAYHNDKLGTFAAALAKLAGKDMVLPMNTGAEAVETGIKVARAWGYRVKGIPADAARVIVAGGNFHGRTITIVGFSDDPAARDAFGPYSGGFAQVPFGDAAAIEAAEPTSAPASR